MKLYQELLEKVSKILADPTGITYRFEQEALKYLEKLATAPREIAQNNLVAIYYLAIAQGLLRQAATIPWRGPKVFQAQVLIAQRVSQIRKRVKVGREGRELNEDYLRIIK